MRLKLYLNSENGIINIPFNYNHILSAVIYNLIEDIEFAKELHSKLQVKGKRRSSSFTMEGMRVPFQRGGPHAALGGPPQLFLGKLK